jgi:hypothetical protein
LQTEQFLLSAISAPFRLSDISRINGKPCQSSCLIQAKEHFGRTDIAPPAQTKLQIVAAPSAALLTFASLFPFSPGFCAAGERPASFFFGLPGDLGFFAGRAGSFGATVFVSSGLVVAAIMNNCSITIAPVRVSAGNRE